ncbi:MAG: hypothetical protein ACI8T1_004216 [Verrucomicrobiales bacterium]|jgi:hypothetical protein
MNLRFFICLLAFVCSSSAWLRAASSTTIPSESVRAGFSNRIGAASSQEGGVDLGIQGHLGAYSQPGSGNAAVIPGNAAH